MGSKQNEPNLEVKEQEKELEQIGCQEKIYALTEIYEDFDSKKQEKIDKYLQGVIGMEQIQKFE